MNGLRRPRHDMSDVGLMKVFCSSKFKARKMRVRNDGPNNRKGVSDRQMRVKRKEILLFNIIDYQPCSCVVIE